MKYIKIKYQFKFDDNRKFTYKVRLDKESLLLIAPRATDSTSWSALEFNQCENCPLNSTDSIDCPVALNLVPLMDLVCNLTSYDEVKTLVTTSERSIYAKTTVQRAISSLLGLIMATSDCNHMYFFRGMARFHLPFADDLETVYRAVSTYLLAQYFLHKKGEAPDMEISGLADLYKNLQIINRNMAIRIRAASEEDAASNAVVLLDLFAKNIPYSIDEAVEEAKYPFSAYIKSKP